MKISRETAIMLILLIGLFQEFAFSQKKTINNETYKTWEKLRQYGVSNNGRYVWYTWGDSQHIQAKFSDLKNESQDNIKTIFDAAFTSDSNWLIYKESADSLAIRDTRTGTTNYLTGVGTYFCFSGLNKESIAYLARGCLFIFDIKSRQSRVFKNVQKFKINEDGTSALVVGTDGLSIINLSNNNVKKISTAKEMLWFVFDKSGKQVAFVNKLQSNFAVWYYTSGLDSAIIKVDSNTLGINRGFKIDNQQPEFTTDGKTLIFKLKKAVGISVDTTVITKDVDIWSYKDTVIQGVQLERKRRGITRLYLAAINLSRGSKVVQLETDNRLLSNYSSKYVLLQNTGDNQNSYYNRSWEVKSELVDISSGKVIRSNLPIDARISPAQKFVTWFDLIKKHFYVYDIEKKILRNISSKIPYSLYQLGPGASVSAWVYPIWDRNDSMIFTGDQYDIWQLDPLGIKPPTNLTNGYGRANHIEFRLACLSFDNVLDLHEGKKIIFRAIDTESYKNGFWFKKLDGKGNPIKGSMEPCLYDAPVDPPAPPKLLKALNAERYLITRQTAIDAPNLYVTGDLKSFRKLSNLQPQKEYNWLTSEQINYTLPNGETNRGILYKPENFDPSKKYPVIFYYYQKLSNEVFHFTEPQLSLGIINIPLYVSNGYVVCVVDILNNRAGQIADIAINSVESAAKFLVAKYLWINGAKMGIQGHSFGGYETNLLVANSALFAAAQSSAGITDMISMYGDITMGDKSLAEPVERGQFNLQTTPWEDTGLYIRSSPVLKANKIRTPLLILNNKEDNSVPWKQGVELFNALRRLQKPCWMLQYDGAGHSLENEEHQQDFTIRQKQFFDHYLMDQPAPLWMTEGVRAEYKGLKSGLQLDFSGK